MLQISVKLTTELSCVNNVLYNFQNLDNEALFANNTDIYR